LLSEKIAHFQIFLKKNNNGISELVNCGTNNPRVGYGLIGAESFNSIAAGSVPFA